MLSDDLLSKKNKNKRLLEVTNQLYLPIETNIRVLLTSADVIHSWAVPALGVKLDACPGRLNEVNFIASCLGVVVGACSEICGVNHGFMPICVKAVSLEDYISWVSTKLEEI